MFKNFFKVTVRSLLKSKLFVFINIVGLGLALACCIVAFLNYDFATSFDEQHENYDELYAISIYRDQAGANIPFTMVPMPLGANLKSDIPGLKGVSRFHRAGITIKKDQNVFDRRVAFVDDDFLDMFTFPLIHGDKDSYKELSSVLISARTAISLFGKEDAVGETLEVVQGEGANLFLTVGGVFEDVTRKSTMQFQLIADFENYHRFFGVEKGDWGHFLDGLFIQTEDSNVINTAPALIEKYAAIQNEARKDFQVSSFWLQDMKDLPFNQRDMNGRSMGAEALNAAHMMAPGIMAILILLLACFNFTNTAIAMSNKRLKEIGIRKTVGGTRGQLVFQFLGENLLLCLLALGVGLVCAMWLVPKYSDMWPNMDILLSLKENPKLVIFLTGVLLATALLAGGYPALFVSRFKPVAILRGTLKVGSSSILSKVLLGFQFMISVLALISGFAFLQNSAYQKAIDQGYDKESMVLAFLSSPLEAERFKAAIMENPAIEEISLTRHHVGWGANGAAIKSGGQEYEVSIMDIGLNYSEVAGFQVIDGRGFNEQNRQTDRSNSILVNEKMAAQYGWDNAIGQQVTLYDTIRYNVVGVVKDFFIFGLWEELDPMMIRLRDDSELSRLVVRVSPDEIQEVKSYMEGKWGELITDRPAEIMIHEQDVLGEARTVNDNIVAIFLFLAIIAVVLSAIGLFTLVSINIQSRTKEIGIRKVLGASVSRIGAIINRPFLIIVAIAAVLGAVAAYLLTGMLMDMIWKYHMDLNLFSFLLPIIGMLLISLFSISGKVVKAARRNPVESLRYE
ncbi:ABC transporter permease [Roseivirga sp. E12]|uniref:ABC transporter permease n=1 Tax=Roseivirga sp. E12 TaxID=2819237 RepID=UPI001ABBEFB9|nr:ABC transporter permease [Roseivirga sp. E12]MBO3700016.1 ABC transporter permease [Roseivirga sp. E12]